MDVNTALTACKELKTVSGRLEVLQSLDLGYPTLGEETPGLLGGEAQRLKFASEMGKAQTDSVFVFDEPTIGLHPLNVQTLFGVFRTLVDNGATSLSSSMILTLSAAPTTLSIWGPKVAGTAAG
jgi:excinuclease ABC subunit A